MTTLTIHEIDTVAHESLEQSVSVGLGSAALSEVEGQGASQNEAEHSAEVSKLSRLLVKDYYQTFRLSQGEPAVQPPLFKLIADEYRKSTPSPVLETAIRSARVTLDRLMPPATHTDKTEGRAITSKDFVEPTWDEYVQAITDPDYTGNGRTMELMLEDILARDVDYQAKGRPNRNEAKGQDKYESIVREYVLGDKLPGSEHLMKVRDGMRHALLNAEDTGDRLDVYSRLHSLAGKWEENHPGQQFFDAER